jgi:hypothetical protein
MQEAALTFAEIISGARIIPLSKGKITFVDEEDYSEISKTRWCFQKETGYAKRHRNRATELMHRVINKTPADKHTDHKNGNKLDNRRFNLRTATPSQNLGNHGIRINNTSGFKGVSFDKTRGLWFAKITINRKQIPLGRFVSAELAHVAYCSAAHLYFKNFARTK